MKGVRIKFHSKPQAIETPARHLSMYRDNVDLNVNVSLADLVNGSYRLERGEPRVVDGKARLGRAQHPVHRPTRREDDTEVTPATADTVRSGDL